MKKLAIAWITAALAAAANAQLGASVETNTVYYSEIHEAPRRIKEEVVQREEGGTFRLMDRKRVIAKMADMVAEQITVEAASEIAEAWQTGFAQGVEELRAAFTNAPKSGVFVGLDIPYDNTGGRSTIDIYVASNHYDSFSGYDLLWVYFNRVLLKPRIEVPYCWTGGVKRVTGSWEKSGTSANWTNLYTVVKGGFSYDCHLLFSKRPEEMAGAAMNLRPYGKFGNPETGIAWGSVQTMYRGRASLTGTLSDGTNDWEFVNGQLMSISKEHEE